MRAHQILLIALSAAVVSACSDFYTMAPRPLLKAVGNYNVVSTGVTMASDKTLLDHLVSYNSGKDCSTVRTEQGRTYCREDEPNPVYAGYCYKTLADVTCYAQPQASQAHVSQAQAPQVPQAPQAQ